MKKPILSEISPFRDFCLNNNVKPLKQDCIIPAKKLPPRQTRYLPESESSSDFSAYNILDDYTSHAEFCTEGQMHLIKALRLGKLRCVATLDLHECKQNTAVILLEEFIRSKITQGNTCLKIIHGKGLNSPQNKPVLKLLVRRFLEHHPRLLAYSPGGENNGGDGVTLVKLKGASD